jgi:YjjG family noncanonical pyrimidine nucleotidase
MSQAFEWILFDADGTLLDYDAAEAAALREGLERCGLPWSDAILPRYRIINRFYWSEYEAGRISQEELREKRFAHLLEDLGFEASAALLSGEYLCSLSTQRTLLPGALELVKDLSQSHQLLLITNGIPEVQRGRLKGNPLADYFPKVLISGEVGAAKPDPAIFDIAFEEMGQPGRERTIIVGDSLSSDIQGGINYSMPVCWYNPGKLEVPEDMQILHVIHELDELRKVPGIQNGNHQ